MSCVQVVVFVRCNKQKEQQFIDTFFHDEKKHHGTMDEPSSKQQFCKFDVIIPLLYKKSEAMLPVLVDLMTGQQSDIDLKFSGLLATSYHCKKYKYINSTVGFYYPNTNFPNGYSSICCRRTYFTIIQSDFL